MARTVDKKSGEIIISGWEKGIAPSPYEGLGDIKGMNISSIKGEAALNYNRVRLDQPATSGTMTVSAGSPTVFVYSGNITSGTWILVGSHTGSPGTTDGHYYFVKPNVVGVSYFLYSDFGTTQITAGGNGTISFSTLAMGVPEDYCVEANSSTSPSFRYFILDQNGVIWVSGEVGMPGAPFEGGNTFSSTTVWSAITPYGTTATGFTGYGAGTSIQIMYATDSSNKIQANYLMIFGQSQIFYGRNDNNSGWPSVTGADFTTWKTMQYSGGYYHKSILGNDQVIYFTDGPGVGVIQQKTGQVFDPSSASTYNYADCNYLMSPTDAATRIAMIAVGNGIGIAVGGQQNNLYIYASLQVSGGPAFGAGSAIGPITLLWMPEANTQYLLQVNNYVLIFCGNKGNIYLTNGSSVVPIFTVPDYVAGAENYVEDPYFIWGGAMYLRGRVFFSIKDQTGSHTGNCGGVWSFVPSFNYFPEQDVGNAIRMENASSLYATEGFNGYAPVLFAGQELTAQQADGPQYIAAWAQSVNSIDFSGTNPVTNASCIIETDALPVGTIFEKKTFKQIEVKWSAALAVGESIAINYRTSLEAAWASAGNVIYESNKLASIINGLNFQTVQLLQLQLVFTGTSTSPSWMRIKEVYIR